MAEVDTSSYPKAGLPVSPLDMASKFGALQQQQQQIQSGGLTIDRQKLENADKGLNFLTRAFSSIGPDGTKEQYAKVGQDAVKMGLAPPEMLNTYITRLNAAPTPQSFYNEIMTAAASHQEMLNYHLGTPGTVSNNQTIQPVVTSPKPGFGGMRSNGLPIQLQPPPTSSTMGLNNVPSMLGAQDPQLPPSGGAVAAPPPVNGLPVSFPGQPNVSAAPPLMPNKDQGRVAQGNPASPVVPVARGPVTGLPQMFEEGKKQLTQDQELATNKLTAIKPILQALPLLEGLRSGPTTEGFNKIVATLKANGILPIDAKNDPTAIYQEVNKKLSQYVAGSSASQRSDAAQTLSEASSPSVKTQINPALIKLTKDAIILDRVQAARPNAFEGNDYSQYGKHRSMFPAQVDERAFGLDLMKSDERKELLDDMKKKQKTFEGQRFWKSLDTVKKLQLYNTSGE